MVLALMERNMNKDVVHVLVAQNISEPESILWTLVTSGKERGSR